MRRRSVSAPQLTSAPSAIAHPRRHSFLPEAVGDVRQFVAIRAIQALVGIGVLQWSAVLAVGSHLHIVKSIEMYAFGQFLPTAVPACLQSRETLLGQRAEAFRLLRVVVAAHQAYAGHLARIVLQKGAEAFFRKLFAVVAAEVGAVAAGTEVRTEGQVDGERNLVGKFLEHYVVIDVLEHILWLPRNLFLITHKVRAYGTSVSPLAGVAKQKPVCRRRGL